MSNKEGSLIVLHYHDNKELLDFLSFNGKLHYNDIPIVRMSQEEGNVAEEREDGIYVDGRCILSKEQFDLLNRFSYNKEKDELLFDSVIVSREYEQEELWDMLNGVWNNLNVYYPEFDVNKNDNKAEEEVTDDNGQS